jgi:hypothetical protein
MADIVVHSVTDYGALSIWSGNPTARTWAGIANLPTDPSQGLLLLVVWGDAANERTLGNATLSQNASGSPENAPYSTAAFTNSTDKRGQWFFWPSITDSTQDLSVEVYAATQSGTIDCIGFVVSNHLTDGDPLAVAGTGTSSPTNLTASVATSAIFANIQGGNAEPPTAAATWPGGGGVDSNLGSSQDRTWITYKLVIGSTSPQSVSWTQSGSFINAVELKTGGGVPPAVMSMSNFSRRRR